MGKGSGNTRNSSSNNPRGLSGIANSPLLSKRTNDFLNAAQSGEIDRMSAEDESAYLKKFATLKESSLRDARDIYSDDEWDAIEAYGGRWGDYINEYMNGTNRSSPGAQLIKLSNDLNTAMSRRKLTKDIIVFRGSEGAEDNPSGRFVSTTLSPVIANKFRHWGPNIHAYKIPKGTNYIYITNRGESEVLLPRGLDLRKYLIK